MNLNAHMYKYHNYPRLSLPFSYSFPFILIPHTHFSPLSFIYLYRICLTPFLLFSPCSIAVCSLDCGRNGVCESGKCRCNPGWTGNLCDQLPCDTRCSEHGQCKNGTCVCSQGWNGRHCTLRKYILCLFTRKAERELKKRH